MNLDRFATLVEAYGADPHRWPVAERAAAQALLAASTEARRLLQQAEALDLVLSVPPAAIEPSDALRARIMAQVTPHRASPQHGWRSQIAEALLLLFPTGRAVPQLATLGLALAIGVGAGLANIDIADSRDNDLIILQLAAATPVSLEE